MDGASQKPALGNDDYQNPRTEALSARLGSPCTGTHHDLGPLCRVQGTAARGLEAVRSPRDEHDAARRAARAVRGRAPGPAGARPGMRHGGCGDYRPPRGSHGHGPRSHPGAPRGREGERVDRGGGRHRMEGGGRGEPAVPGRRVRCGPEPVRAYLRAPPRGRDEGDAPRPEIRRPARLQHVAAGAVRGSHVRARCGLPAAGGGPEARRPPALGGSERRGPAPRERGPRPDVRPGHADGPRPEPPALPRPPRTDRCDGDPRRAEPEGRSEGAGPVPPRVRGARRTVLRRERRPPGLVDDAGHQGLRDPRWIHGQAVWEQRDPGSETVIAPPPMRGPHGGDVAPAFVLLGRGPPRRGNDPSPLVHDRGRGGPEREAARPAPRPPASRDCPGAPAQDTPPVLPRGRPPRAGRGGPDVRPGGTPRDPPPPSIPAPGNGPGSVREPPRPRGVRAVPPDPPDPRTLVSTEGRAGPG